jgi:hypothetical protein
MKKIAKIVVEGSTERSGPNAGAGTEGKSSVQGRGNKFVAKLALTAKVSVFE